MMTESEILRRKIFLKKQAVSLIKSEIRMLRKELYRRCFGRLFCGK